MVDRPVAAVFLAVWGLVVHREVLPGLWVCMARRFATVEDWQAREAIREEG